MTTICSEANKLIDEFINREAIYIYSPNSKRKFFTLEDKEDFVHNSDATIDEYILKHNLEYKWTRQYIKDTFTYKQMKHFNNSNLSLDEYIKKYNLYESTFQNDNDNNNDNDNEFDYEMHYNLHDTGDENSYDSLYSDNDSWGE